MLVITGGYQFNKKFTSEASSSRQSNKLLSEPTKHAVYMWHLWFGEPQKVTVFHQNEAAWMFHLPIYSEQFLICIYIYTFNPFLEFKSNSSRCSCSFGMFWTLSVCLHLMLSATDCHLSKTRHSNKREKESETTSINLR